MTRPLFRRLLPPRAPEQFDEELAFHREMLAEKYRERGLNPGQARDAIAVRLGNVARSRAECARIGRRKERRMLRITVWEQLVQDLRFAARGLLRHKGWTIVALFTLAVGIGACTAVYSVVNSLLLHPVAYPAADRIVLVYNSPTSAVGIKAVLPPMADALRAWRTSSREMTAIEPAEMHDMQWNHGGTIDMLHTGAVTPTFATFTGQQAIAGRNFTAEDVRATGGRVAILSRSAWRNRFGGAPSTLGTSITLDDRSYTIVGIYPDQMRFPQPGIPATDVWLPLDLAAAKGSLMTVARLRAGATIKSAEHELDAIAVDQHLSSAAFHVALRRPAEMVGFREALELLLAAVVMVMLIACVNVAHLLLARGISREREFAVRVSLGASRVRLVRQLITETVTLTLMGCAAGAALGYLALHAILAVRPNSIAELDRTHLDTRVVLGAFALALLTGLVFGLVASAQLIFRAPARALRAGAPASGTSRGQHRMRFALVLTEMAISAALLVGAALLVRTMIRLEHADPGFDASNLYAIKTPWTPQIDALGARLHTIPGVTGVIAAQAAPPQVGVMINAIDVEGTTVKSAIQVLEYNAVTPGYFRFMNTPFIAGTTFSDSSADSPQVIVSEGFAREYWNDASAIGKRLRLDTDTPWLTVVGEVRDISTNGSLGSHSEPMVYITGPEPKRAFVYLVRAKPGFDPRAAMKAVDALVGAHSIPSTITRAEDELTATLARPRFTMLLLLSFAVVAVLLAGVGLYGVLAYTVRERQREIGIRMALGASRGAVLRDVLRAGAVLAVSGTLLGLGLARLTARVMEKMLYGTPSTDASAFLTAAVLMAVVAVAASVVPARRSMRVDPMTAIRGE